MTLALFPSDIPLEPTSLWGSRYCRLHRVHTGRSTMTSVGTVAPVVVTLWRLANESSLVFAIATGARRRR